MEGIKVYSPNTCTGPANNYIENVVYHELLDASIPPADVHFDPPEGPHLADYTDSEEDNEYEMYP